MVLVTIGPSPEERSQTFSGEVLPLSIRVSMCRPFLFVSELKLRMKIESSKHILRFRSHPRSHCTIRGFLLVSYI